jgi:type I restriction enzyme, S subunit
VRAYWTNGTVPWVSPKDMKRPRLDSAEDLITAAAVQESATRLVPAKSVLLVARSGILERTLPVAINDIPVALNQDMKAVAPRGVLPEYLVNVLRSHEQDILHNCAKAGTTVANLDLPRFYSYRVPVAPLNEQRRIVAKLEELQARSRRAREALEAVPPLLEKLRQSILAAAFRGDLTKDWRAQNPNPEPASALLARIRTERRKKWEESELAKLKAKGKPPTDDRWKAKYKEPEPVDTTGLPELPEGWCWASVEEVTSAARSPCYGVVQPGEDVVDGVPLVRVCDLRGDGRAIDIENLRKIPAVIDEEYERSRLRGGELLVSVVGTIGRTAIAPEALRGANIARAVARLVFDEQRLVEWTMYWFNSLFMWHRLNLESREVARKTLNVSQLVEAPVPVPPLSEVTEVVAQLISTDQTIERLWAKATTAVGTQSSLEQALLAKAFRGELVPQDPNDEPADALLARLRADAAPESPRARKRRSKAAE